MTSSRDALALPSSDEVGRRVTDLQRASGDFNVLLGRYGEPGPALRHYGLIRWQNAEVDAAIDAFRASLGLTPENADLWRDLAGAYDASGRADLADLCIRTSIGYGPDAARSWLLLAQLRSRALEHDAAEAAFHRALVLDATLGDAHFGLGLVHFARRRLDEAVASLGAAIANGYANALGFTALGHVLYLAGRFAACAAAFEDAGRFAPLERDVRRKQGRARAFAVMIDGHPDRAMADYADLVGADGEEPDDVLRDGFSVLSAYGHHEAALAVGRLRLSREPEDAAQRYLLDALSGHALARAPVDYLERHFDRFAKTFDHKLVDVLLYRAPEDMAALVAQTRTTFADTLDLGCGTGLAAAHLAPFGGRLTGVDVSGGMLAEAAKRGLYADLVKAEALDYLALHRSRFDLVFAADVLIYFGDLQPLFGAVARSTAPGALVALSIETTTTDDYKVLTSGRFAHSAAYVERLAAPDFDVLARHPTTIRLEAGQPAEGLLMVLARRP